MQMHNDTPGNRPVSASHSEKLRMAFITACLKLDISGFASMMEDDDEFEDLPKPAFLKRLNYLFSMRRARIGDNFTAGYRLSTCTGCDQGKGHAVLHFEYFRNRQKIPFSDFAFLIHEETGVLVDIFRCWQYDSAYMMKIPFGDDAEVGEAEWLNWEWVAENQLRPQVDSGEQEKEDDQDSTDPDE